MVRWAVEVFNQKDELVASYDLPYVHLPVTPETKPEAEAELAVGFFGSRYERATPAEREYLRAMAEIESAAAGAAGVPTADVATALDRKPQSLSPARDALIKKGLIYTGERGRVAFTVPHFGRYLRGRDG